MSNSSYLDRYLLTLQEIGKKTGTIKQYNSDLQQFISWLNSSVKIDLLHINATHIFLYVEHLKKKQTAR